MYFKTARQRVRPWAGCWPPIFGERSDVVLLAIPMGGLPVALEIQEALLCPMDLVVVRKLQIPGDTEAALDGKTVILVDDGPASSYTMKVTIYMAAKSEAAVLS